MVIHFSRLQVSNLASKIGLVKYGNFVKLSLKLWPMLPIVSLCMKVSVEIETSLRVIIQIHHIVFESFTLPDMLVG